MVSFAVQKLLSLIRFAFFLQMTNPQLTVGFFVGLISLIIFAFISFA